MKYLWDNVLEINDIKLLTFLTSGPPCIAIYCLSSSMTIILKRSIAVFSFNEIPLYTYQAHAPPHSLLLCMLGRSAPGH